MSEQRMPGAAERWRSLSPFKRAALAVLALVMGLNVSLAGIERVAGGAGPRGEPSSSYATAPDGAAAYADLLARHGHPLGRVRTSLDRAELGGETTLVVLDPRELDGSQAEAVDRFVRGGGRLVAAGRETAPALRRLLGGAPVWSPEGANRATPMAPAAEVAGVGAVAAEGEGSWSEVGPALPVLGHEGRVLAAVATVDRGRVVLLADPSVLQNKLLATQGNAAFGVAAAGPPGRPVAFAEAAHGYRDGVGLGALPSRWRWALGGTVVATLVWMWSRGKRLGPVEEASRPLPPPRRAYVDAVAATLARTKQPDAAIEPLRRVARSGLARRAGLPTGASDDDLVEAARRLGGNPDDVARLLAPVGKPGAVGGDDDLLGAGRAAAWVQEMQS